MKKLKEQSESELHAAICEYIRIQYPNVLFNTDLSGIKLTLGQAKKVSKLRSNRGFPDIFFPEPRGNYNGLFIELKKLGVNLKKKTGLYATEHIQEQSEMIEKLNKRGYYARFAIGFVEARQIIDYYLNLK